MDIIYVMGIFVLMIRDIKKMIDKKLLNEILIFLDIKMKIE